MNWLILVEILYVVILILVCLRIIYDTRANTKALAYLLLVIFVPFLGFFFYFSFGVNYRKRKLYDRKLIADEKLAKQLEDELLKYSEETFNHGGVEVKNNRELAYMLATNGKSALTANNAVKILINGEQKFPEVLAALQAAKNHIHIEYYIYEDDEIGQTIAQLLAQKAKEGVEVRFIYDDFGSRSIRKKLVPYLKAAGVYTSPFYRVKFWAFANRLNYRNHRKIIVIDGLTGFVGGINVSDKYINHKDNSKKLYWRDTHIRIDGPGVRFLQNLFLNDWNFCAEDSLQPNKQYYPNLSALAAPGDKIVQIAASGPDSDTPTILFAMLQAINHAKSEILITTPYFIPSESIIDALVVSALGGINVKLLVPGVSDSKLVNLAAHSYYDDLLAAGVEVYLYNKGFVHAKTMVCDQRIAIVGTANTDYRSFDLNFEVNAIVYDEETATTLATVFEADLKDAVKIDPEEWKNRSTYKQLLEKTARLISPLL